MSPITKKLFSSTFQKPKIDKIEESATSFLNYCCALVLPGGSDIEPELYTDGFASPAQHDYRRSIVELALLENAHKRQMPILGICRGSQMINVYLGGTLRDLPKDENEWHHLSLSNSSKQEELQQWIGGINLLALSMHHQAADKIGDNLEIIIEREGIPKLLMSHDAQFIAVQFHPEVYVVDGFIKDRPEAIHNKGIYQLFFSKILQYRMLGV